MNDTNLLGVQIKSQSKTYILEKIIKFIHDPYAFFHIVSLNPENSMRAMNDVEFQNILSEGDIQLIDGIGIALGCAFLRIETGGRITGTDFIEILFKHLKLEGLRVLLLGGQPKLAEDLAVCYAHRYPQLVFKGHEGFRDIKHPTNTELDHILALIKEYRPSIIFAAYGSPWQEKFFYCHKKSDLIMSRTSTSMERRIFQTLK